MGWASSDLCTDVLTLDCSLPIPLRLCVSPFFIPLLPFLFHLLLGKEEERSWARRGKKEAVPGLNHQRSTDFIFLCLETHACPSAGFSPRILSLCSHQEATWPSAEVTELSGGWGASLLTRAAAFSPLSSPSHSLVSSTVILPKKEKLSYKMKFVPYRFPVSSRL